MKTMEETTATFEDAAVIFSDIISTLEDFVSAYNDSLWIDEASEDVENDEGRKRMCFAMPRAPKHVQRRSEKLWRINRAIYRPYAWFIALIRPDIIQARRRSNYELF